jgi:SAM-dependent methyltransferase
MTEGFQRRPSVLHALRQWWRESLARGGFWSTLGSFASVVGEFARESTPSRRRQRYGDVEYDWDHRVDTTGATVGWRDRLLGLFHSPYQPTEPALFHEMLVSLHIDFREFTFIDIGSGKGRALLMAADYPFRRILGIELLPELHRVAQENISKYRSDSQKCFAVESICGDAADFEFPLEPTVLYLFNPLPEAGLTRMLENLAGSLRRHPRPVFVIYHNPLLAHVASADAGLRKIGGTHQYFVFAGGTLGAHS